MTHPPDSRNGKVATPTKDEATFLKTPGTSGAESFDDSPKCSEGASAQAAMMRILAARLDRLGLAHSATDANNIVIAGQCYSLHSAASMARQLGRPA